MKLLLPLVLILPLSLWAAEEGQESFPAPKPNHPWLHAKSGLRFPAGLAGMSCDGGVDFVNDPALGQSLRYINQELRVRADVYVFPCPAPVNTLAAKKEALRHEAGNVVAGIEQMEKRGYYSGIQQNEVTYDELDFYPKGSAKSGWLQFSVNATVHEDSPGGGKSAQKIFSYTGITIYEGYFVKVRCTVPAEANKELEKQISEFVSAVRFCVFIEPGLRAETKKRIVIYRSDPLSEKGREAVAGIVVYAQDSPLVSFTVSGKLSLLGDSLKSVLPDGATEVVRAYMTGAVDTALQEPLPESPDLGQGGAREIVHLYELLQKEHPKLQSTEMEALMKATKDGKGGAWLLEEAPEVKRKKSKGI